MIPRTFRPAFSARRLLGAAVAVVMLVGLQSGATAAVRPPRLDYTMTALPNGLNVVFLEDHSTPIVHAELWYHVGSKNERAGRTGFAHLFEHMMFKGTPTIGTKDYKKDLEIIAAQERVREGMRAEERKMRAAWRRGEIDDLEKPD